MQSFRYQELLYPFQVLQKIVQAQKLRVLASDGICIVKSNQIKSNIFDNTKVVTIKLYTYVS